MAAFIAYLTLRSRAFFNVLRAAYPTERFEFRRIWGAYIAAYGFNAVVPARGGDVIKLFLTKTSVPNSSYPAVASAMFVENVFDATMARLHPHLRVHAGRVPEAAGLLGDPRLRPAVLRRRTRGSRCSCSPRWRCGALIGFALLSARVRAFWERVRQGLTILWDRRRYFREVWLVQFAGWLCRFTAFWFLLEAFNVGGSVQQRAARAGGQRGRRGGAVHAGRGGGPAGAAREGLRRDGGGGDGRRVLGRAADRDLRGGLAVGFAALFFIFRFRSFKEVIAAGRAHREAERAEREGSPIRRVEVGLMSTAAGLRSTTRAAARHPRPPRRPRRASRPPPAPCSSSPDRASAPARSSSASPPASPRC